MTLLKRGAVYYAVVRVQGKQRWIRCGTDRREARRRHDELMLDARAGRLGLPTKLTFEEFSRQFVTDYCDVRLKPSTRKEYRSYIDTHLVPFFGQRRLADITTRDIQAYVGEKTRQGRLAPKSIRNHLVVLKRMMAVALEWEVLKTNPALKVTAPRVPRPEIKFLSPAEMQRLIAATDEEHRLLIATACLVGARKGELLALKHDAVSIPDRTITIKRTLYAGEIQEPKSQKSIRVLPMPDVLVPMYESQLPAAQPDGFVFSTAAGQPLANGTPNRVLKRALKAAGLDESVTFHGLRHSFIAAAIQARIPLKVIQELAGHSSITITMDRYGHLLPGAQEEAIKAVSDAVFTPEDTDENPLST